ncbi:MAG: LamG-like jellyroll fold domain-containing protein [Armatimonadota bacterium]
MTRWMRLLLFFSLFWVLVMTVDSPLRLLSSSDAAAPVGSFSDELNTSLYDCRLSLVPAAALSESSALIVMLDWQSKLAYTRLIITRRQIMLSAVSNGKETACGQTPSGVMPGKPYQLTILRRGTWLGLLLGETFIFRGEVPRPAGRHAGLLPGAGWSVEEARVQRLEPVAFTDNFMRTTAKGGAWQAQHGDWKLSSPWDSNAATEAERFDYVPFAQNPFAWSGSTPDAVPALCTTGKSYWEDYTVFAAIHSSFSAAMGVVVNMPDPSTGLLVRWSSAADRSPRGNRLSVYHMAGGEMRLLGESPGGFLPEQWYRLAVTSSLGRLRVTIDGRERLVLDGVLPWHGGVGLYAEGRGGVTFDDVIVYGSTLNTDIIAENRLLRINERYRYARRDTMNAWANIQNEWQWSNGQFRTSQWDYYGDHWLALTARPSRQQSGQLFLLLNGDAGKSNSGYIARVTSTASSSRVTCEIFRNDTLLATAAGTPLEASTPYRFRFRRKGNRLTLEMDGTAVVSADDAHPLNGSRPGYRASGSLGQVSDVIALGSQSLDYTFADAPVDWRPDGHWLPTILWACDPKWSFLGGWSRGDAVLWHKWRFAGDQTFETHVAEMMEYPGERQVWQQRYRDFGVTICGDGHDPRSGYAVIYGAPDEQGNPNRRAVLLRNGTVVAATSNLRLPDGRFDHVRWFGLKLKKTGNLVEFSLDGYPTLRYTDPAPLEGGYPAIWTNDNAMAIARARVHFARLQQSPATAQVYLGDPWRPEWADIGRPLTLSFPLACSSSGKPVNLQARTREAPAGETAAPTVHETYLSFTPRIAGEHWYEVRAVDGDQRSPAFHLSVPVFTPSLGRDDTHALVLYRFDEGKGNRVVDHSAVAPRADLMFTQGETAHWLPQQGLLLSGPALLMTQQSVEKLMAIRTNRACSLEFWLSAATAHPHSEWVGTLLCWGTGNGQQNFTLAQFTNEFKLLPRGSVFRRDNAPTLGVVNQWFYIGLRHYVVTWDGRTTRIYMNGNLLGELNASWNPDRWSTGQPLLLGSQGDQSQNYEGTYYLVAVHDRSLTPTEIQRHYQAGPSAR